MITLGGALIGLLCALYIVVPWVRKGGSGGDPFAKGGGGGKSRDWKALRPFGAAFLVGTTCSLCVGGLLGQAAQRIVGGANTLGGQLLGILTGAASPSVARHAQQQLSPYGAALLILVIGAGVFLWRIAKKKLRVDMTLGLISGATLGPTAGVAGIAAVIAAPAFNQLGGAIFKGVLG